MTRNQAIASAGPDGAPEFGLRIVRGNPTEAQIAALVAVVAVLGAARPRTEAVGQVQLRPRRRHGRLRHQHCSAGPWRRHQRGRAR